MYLRTTRMSEKHSAKREHLNERQNEQSKKTCKNVWESISSSIIKYHIVSNRMCILSQRYTEHWVRFVWFANLVSSFQLFVSFSHTSTCVRACVCKLLRFDTFFPCLLLYHTNFPHAHTNERCISSAPHKAQSTWIRQNEHWFPSSQFTLRINAFRMFRSLRSDLVVSTNTHRTAASQEWRQRFLLLLLVPLLYIKTHLKSKMCEDDENNWNGTKPMQRDNKNEAKQNTVIERWREKNTIHTHNIT